MKEHRHSVLLVDDNPAVIASLSQTIDWQTLHCDLYTAESYSEAVSLASRTPIDLLVTDICLPHSDGLSLASWLRRKDPEVRLIFITGFAQIEYARRALRLGACDFILKPIDDSELTEAIEKALQQAVRHYSPASLITELLATREQPEAPWLDAATELLGFIPTEVTALRIISERELSLQEMIPPGCNLTHSEGRELTCLCFRQTESLIQHLQAALEHQKPSCSALGIGTTVSLEDASASLKEATKAAKTAFYYSPAPFSTVARYQDLFQNPSALSQLGALLEEFERATTELDGRKAHSSLEEIEKHLRASLEELPDPDGARELFKGTAIHLYRQRERLLSLHPQTPLLEILDTIDSSKDYRKSLELLGSEVDLLQKTREEAERHQYSPAVRICLEYIRTNYPQQLSLGRAAELCELSSGYLSRLLKQETGMSFSVLVNHIRIAEAVRLLSGTTMKVYQVAEATGFENTAYFHQVFRKVTGSSPKEYVRIADNLTDSLPFP